MRMALVIFCVLRTEAILPFISLSDAKVMYDLTIYYLQFNVCCHLLDDGTDVIVYLSFPEWCEHIFLVGGA